MRAPRLLAAGTAAASLLLAGCGLEKPSPIVTVVSGGSTVHTEASMFCFDGQDASKKGGTPGACTVDETRQPTVLEVRAGDQIGVDVAKTLADKAWVVVLTPLAPSADGQPPQEVPSGVQTGHYFAFNTGLGTGAKMQVRSLANAEEGAPVTGRWDFVLAPK